MFHLVLANQSSDMIENIWDIGRRNRDVADLFMYVKKDQNRVNMASIVEFVYIIKYYIVMMLHGICDT